MINVQQVAQTNDGPCSAGASAAGFVSFLLSFFSYVQGWLGRQADTAHGRTMARFGMQTLLDKSGVVVSVVVMHQSAVVSRHF
jgi:hypothetical protein